MLRFLLDYGELKKKNWNTLTNPVFWRNESSMDNDYAGLKITHEIFLFKRR